MAPYILSKRRVSASFVLLVMAVLAWAIYDMTLMNASSERSQFANSTLAISKRWAMGLNSNRTIRVICEQPKRKSGRKHANLTAEKRSMARFDNSTLKELEAGIDLRQIQFMDFLNGELGKDSDDGIFGGSLANITDHYDVRENWEHILAYGKFASKTAYNRTNFLQLGRRARASSIIYTVLYDRPDLHLLLASTSSPIASKSELLLFRSNAKEVIHGLTEQLYWWIYPRFKGIKDMADGFSGRGLVLSTGKYHFELAINLLVSLRTVLNSTIPVEVWYAGPDDLEAEQLEMLETIKGVKTFDIYEVFGSEAKLLEGWAIKPFAMLASTFKEVIFVDADVLFLQDPYMLFDRSQIFQRFGQLFFQDRTIGGENPEWFTSWVPNPSNYAKTRRYLREISVHEMESGVVLIDKGRSSVLHAMLAVCKLNSQTERDLNTYIYVHGDKETFWMGWEMMRVPWAFAPAYGGTIGYRNKKGAVCGGLYHPDEDLKPLWWNGGVLKNKHGDVSLYMNFDYVATDVKGYGIKWDWETDTDPFCLRFKNSKDGIQELAPREKWAANKFVSLHKEMKKIGVKKWLRTIDRIHNDEEDDE
ncbi:hypothetical protein HDU97_003296 [Phlyctochytrium planicorne]|nr:hypothetical protein HDU97_003296 [Phlyctochytrium planicorne]